MVNARLLKARRQLDVTHEFQRAGALNGQILDADGQGLVRTLAGLLRIAIGLDRSHSGCVASVSVADDGDGVVVEAQPAEGADLSLERYAADARRDLLEQALSTTVTIRTPT